MNPNNATDVRTSNVSSKLNATDSPEKHKVCAHCASPLNSESLFSGDNNFCCQGCQTVYHLLRTDGYARYYELLADSGKSGGRLDSASLQQDSSDPLRWVSTDECGLLSLYVPGMSCAACIWLLEHTVLREPGVVSARVNLEQRTILMKIDTDSNQSEVIRSTIRKLQSYGYPPAPLARKLKSQNHQTRKDLVNLGIAGAAFGNVMLLATSIYFGDVWGIDAGMARFFNWWSFSIATACLVWPGRIFFQHALLALKSWSLHIDLPIAIALSVAWVTSVYALCTGGALFYFDSITGLVFLLLLGRYVNARIVERAKNLSGAVNGLLPPESADCRPGDIVTVKVGQNFPADGTIADGKTTVDEAALTGESRPILKVSGDKVLGGSRNLSGAVTLTVDAAGESTWIRQLEHRIDEASRGRSHIKTLTEKLLPWFTCGTMLLTIVAGLLWWPSGSAKAVEVMCVVLIVSCPCAIALAAPLSMTIAFRRAWEHGVIIKNHDCLERLATIDSIVLDKTGTLTKGNPSVKSCKIMGLAEPTPDDLALACSVLSKSLHPVARGIATWLKEKLPEHFRTDWPFINVEEFAGEGMIAECADRTVIAGKGKWVADFLALKKWNHSVGSILEDGDEGSSCLVCVLRTEGSELREKTPTTLLFNLHDNIHEDCGFAMKGLLQKFNIWLLSGDRRVSCVAVANAVGIAQENVISTATPEAKLAFIRSLSDAGRKTMMVGDGINDAPALAAATVGVAVKGGVDIALSSADVFLTKPGLARIAELIDFARYTRHTLVLLLITSTAYNLVAVSLALLGILHPGIAALIMPLASLTVLTLANVRTGEHLWKSSTLWCPLPSRLQESQS